MSKLLSQMLSIDNNSSIEFEHCLDFETSSVAYMHVMSADGPSTFVLERVDLVILRNIIDNILERTI